jgi:hypothetical protein
LKAEGKWAEARKLNGEIQKRIRRDKEIYLKEKRRAIEEHNKKGRTRDLYQQIRDITRKPKIQIGTIQSRTGIDQIEKDKIIERWEEYTEELYKKNARTHTYFREIEYTQEPSVVQSEVRKALQDIAGKKATGVDDLSIELIKEAGEPAVTALTVLCQQIWESKK